MLKDSLIFSSIPLSEVAVRGNLKEIENHSIAYQSVEATKKKYRRAPLFLEGAINHRQAIRFFTEYTEMPEVGCYRIKPALIFGKGLIANSDGKLFTGMDLITEESHLTSKLWQSPLSRDSKGYYKISAKRNVLEIKETAILLMKAADHIYGHWLVDILPRIVISQKCGFPNSKYIISKNSPAFSEELLRLSGVKQEQLIRVDEESEFVYCHDLVLPSVCRFRSIMSNIANDVYEKLIQSSQIELNQDFKSIKPTKKLYLSRKKWINPSRRMVNLVEVEALMSQNGFEVIYPEEFSFSEQILLFQQACCIIGEGGSALHNAVFSKAGCCVGVLQGNNNGNFLQSALGDMRLQETGYLFGDSFFRSGNGMTGDFLIPIEHLKRIIKTYF